MFTNFNKMDMFNSGTVLSKFHSNLRDVSVLLFFLYSFFAMDLIIMTCMNVMDFVMSLRGDVTEKTQSHMIFKKKLHCCIRKLVSCNVKIIPSFIYIQYIFNLINNLSDCHWEINRL